MRISDRVILSTLEEIERALRPDPILFEYWNINGEREILTIDEILKRESTDPTGAAMFKVISGKNINDLEKMLQFTQQKARSVFYAECEEANS